MTRFLPRLAAEDVGGLYAPVAAAWAAALARDPSLQLYQSDGLHPTYLGSYLASLVIYSRIMGKNPVGLPASFPLCDGSRVNIPDAVARLLQESAWEVVGPTLSS